MLLIVLVFVPGHRRNVVHRILVSLLSYGITFSFITMAALLYTSNSALASSYGSMGGSSYSSTSSTDDDDGHSYFYESSANKTCTCDTNCTECIYCDIQKEGYKQERNYDNSCSCYCHSHCFFHKEIDCVGVFIEAICAFFPIILFISYVATGDLADPTGTMLIFQV